MNVIMDLELLVKEWPKRDSRIVDLMDTTCLYVPCIVTNDIPHYGAVEIELYGNAIRALAQLGLFRHNSQRFMVHLPNEHIIPVVDTERARYFQYLRTFWDHFTIGGSMHFTTINEFMANQHYREDDWRNDMLRRERQQMEAQRYAHQMHMQQSLGYMPPLDHYGMPVMQKATPETVKVSIPDIDSLMEVKADKEVKKFNIKIEF